MKVNYLESQQFLEKFVVGANNNDVEYQKNDRHSAQLNQSAEQIIHEKNSMTTAAESTMVPNDQMKSLEQEFDEI